MLPMQEETEGTLLLKFNSGGDYITAASTPSRLHLCMRISSTSRQVDVKVILSQSSFYRDLFVPKTIPVYRGHRPHHVK